LITLPSLWRRPVSTSGRPGPTGIALVSIQS
jgi:hypothetical protein